MRKYLINEISKILEIKKSNMIEKDIILHEILSDLSKNTFFYKNFIFKGGTCLIKSYLGYVRFSEDIDFTWSNQNIFKNFSQKEVRRHLSQKIEKIGKIFEKIAKKRKLDFRYIKSNSKYVELGGSNKFCTFKIWFKSEIHEYSFIKIQINFIEKLYFNSKKKKLKSLGSNNKKKLEVLFPEYDEYYKTIIFEVYDAREIFCEKIRAILTRRGIKARDFIDVYLLSKQKGISMPNMEEHIVNKTVFALNFYHKYRINLKNKIKVLESEKFFEWGQEKNLLLLKLDEKDFYQFLKDFQGFLKVIIPKIIDRCKNLDQE